MATVYYSINSFWLDVNFGFDVGDRVKLSIGSTTAGAINYVSGWLTEK